MVMRLHVTKHAYERWKERTGLPRSILSASVSKGVLLPPKKAGKLAARKWKDRRDPRARQVRYYATATAVLVVTKERVLTCMPLSTEDLATVLVWVMTGCWEST